MPGATNFPGSDPYMNLPADFRLSASDDALVNAIRELTAEVRGLRSDLRREILAREIDKLPAALKSEE